MKTWRIVLLALVVLAASMVASADAQRLSIRLDTPTPLPLGHFGESVAVGDVNGDTYADIVVGALYEGGGACGRVHVFFGPNGSPVWTLDMPVPQADARFGASVAVGYVDTDLKINDGCPMVGPLPETGAQCDNALDDDLDAKINDGCPAVGPPETGAQCNNALNDDEDSGADIVVGAPFEDVGLNTDQGRVYVFSSVNGSLFRTLDTPGLMTGHFGWSVAVGYVDGVAGADIVVGAPDEGEGASGRVYVFSGGLAGPLIHTLTSPNPEVGGQFGHSVAVGDVDVDYRADIAVGAHYEDVGGRADEGRAYVFSGANGLLLRPLEMPTGQAGAHFGNSVAVGYVNTDQNADIAVGTPDEDVGLNPDQGRAYVFSGAGSSPPLPPLFILDTPNAWPSGHFGFSVAVGNVDNDQSADIAVGAYGEVNPRAYVFSGDNGSLFRTLTNPSSQTDNQFGVSLAVGDVDNDIKVNDGCPAVGAPETGVQCQNSVDDDGDTKINDGCPAVGPPEAGVQCVNAVDDDADTLINDGCPAGPPETGVQCQNSVDDDADTKINDGCPAVGPPETGAQCNNALNDDEDSMGDIAVGAPVEAVGDNPDQGRAYVFSLEEAPPPATDGFDVDFDAANISYLGDSLGPFHADGAATIDRGPSYWSGGRECADFTIKSMTLTGTLLDAPVVIKAGEGLPYGVPHSTGVICEGSPESDIDLDLYIVVEVHAAGGTFYLINPHNRIMSTCYCGGGTGIPPQEACSDLCTTSPGGETCSNTDTSFPLADPANKYTVVAEVTPSEEEGTCALLFGPVGGIAKLPDMTAGSDLSAESSSGSGFNYTALGGALAAVAAVVVLGGGAWFARRRWGR